MVSFPKGLYNCMYFIDKYTVIIFVEGLGEFKMNTKKMSLFVLLVLMLALVPSIASAESLVDVNVEYIRIDGEQYDPYDLTDDNIEVRRGDDLPVRIKLKAGSDVENVQVMAEITGYEYSQYESDKVFTRTRTFDMSVNDTKTVDLDLEIPVRMDERYTKLRIRVSDEDGISYEKMYQLHVVGVEREDAVIFKEIEFSPANEVMVGRAVSALVKVENVGDNDLDDVTLLVRIPELGVQDVETLDQVDAGEKETFERIILRVPSDANPGQYTVEFTVRFDEYESTTETRTLRVLESDEVVDESPVQKTMVTVPEAQHVTKGTAGAVFPITITNLGDGARTYTLDVQGVDAWGTSRVDPGSVVSIPKGASATAFIYVNALDTAEAGNKIFKVTIGADGESKEIALTAIVDEASSNQSWSGVKRALEIGLVVLVIILILLGLIIGFNKLRDVKDDDDDESKTYY